MPDEKKPGYWAVLPARVRYDPDLRPNAKLLYAEIQALADASGYCWSSNDYLAKLFGLAPRTISDLISKLAARSYITVEVLRDPKTNEVIERRIWVDKPVVVESQDTAGESDTPIAKNGYTPHAENSVTPHAKNGDKNNLNNINNIPPIAPQGGRRKKAPKTAPDWKPERFAPFWDYYRTHGRGESKQAAIRAWDRLQPDDDLIDTMARALVRQVASRDWQAGIGIPYASTWLNNARWEDTPKPQVKALEAPEAAAGRRVVVDREEVPEW